MTFICRSKAFFLLGCESLILDEIVWRALEYFWLHGLRNLLMSSVLLLSCKLLPMIGLLIDNIIIRLQGLNPHWVRLRWNESRLMILGNENVRDVILQRLQLNFQNGDLVLLLRDDLILLLPERLKEYNLLLQGLAALLCHLQAVLTWCRWWWIIIGFGSLLLFLNFFLIFCCCWQFDRLLVAFTLWFQTLSPAVIFLKSESLTRALSFPSLQTAFFSLIFDEFFD